VQEFGNVKGKIRMTNAGVTVELPVVAWQNNQVIAGYQGVIGVLGGPSQVSIGTTDGSWSNPDDVVFDAIRTTIHVPAEPMHVESCSKGTSDNQCNGQHLSEGDLQQFAYKNPPAIVGHHYDNCKAVCLKGGYGNDTYSLPPLKFGFRVVGFKAMVTRCGYRESVDGSWENVGYTGDPRCAILAR